MQVRILNKTKGRIATPITFEVERFSFDVEKGGPAACVIKASGTPEQLDGMRNWLGGYVQVINDNMTPVYWGKLDGVSTIRDGQRRMFTLSEVRNKIRSLFTVTDGDGITYPYVTDWAQDAESVANFGIFEEQRSVGENTLETALATRDRVLAALRKPLESFGIVRSADNGSLRSMSLFDTLAQRYAYRPEGREVYMGEATHELKIGWGFSSSAIGFADKAMHAVNGGMKLLEEGDKFVVSGSASNNGIKTLFLPVEGKFEEYTFGDIALNGIDDIDSVAGNLGFIRKGVFIHLAGSEFNDGYHLTDNPGREHTTTDQNVTGNILTENGLPITIRQGETIRINESITTEIPGATVTIKSVGEKIYYTFTVTSAVAWNVGEIWLRVRREGSPVDGLQVELYTAPVGVVTTLLQAVTLSGSLVSKKTAWTRWLFNNVTTLTPGATYALVVSRTGSLSNTDLYYIDIDDTVGHAGTLGLWNGSTWEARPQGAASVPFQLWGWEYTTTQLYKMLLAHNQYFAGIEMNASSTVVSRLYRDGNTLADYEVAMLLDPGAEDNRLRVRVTPEWHIIVERYPQPTNVRYILRGRRLLNRNGHPLEDGFLPVGEWCIVEGDTSREPFLIGYLEYNAVTNEITDLRAIDAPDPWNVMVRQG